MIKYDPPYTITNKIISLSTDITKFLSKIEKQGEKNLILLKKENLIKTIHSTLAIEQNSLSLDDVYDVINGKKVIGQEREILEVKNALLIYEKLFSLNPFDSNDLLKAHKILMKYLTKENGVFRSGDVGVFSGKRLIHAAPPSKHIPSLISQLFEWTEKGKDLLLIKSCIFHYEFEFIHPFSDGNGRMGRMWQTLLLNKVNPIFSYLPVETIIKTRQQEYYNAIQDSTRSSDSKYFIEFMLSAIRDALLVELYK